MAKEIVLRPRHGVAVSHQRPYYGTRTEKREDMILFVIFCLCTRKTVKAGRRFPLWKGQEPDQNRKAGR